MDKAAIFIDNGYFARVQKDVFSNIKVNYYKFSELLCKNCERLRTYFYDCMPFQSSPPTSEEKTRYSDKDKFFYAIRKLPRFEIRLGKLSYVGGEFVQKRVDVLLSVDLVRMSWDHQIGRAIIVSGDSDLVPAISAAKDAGVLTQLYYSRIGVHDELLGACDDRFEITKKMLDSCKLTR